MKDSKVWTRYFGTIGVLGFLTAFLYFNLLGASLTVSKLSFLSRINHFFKEKTGVNLDLERERFLAKYKNGCPDHRYFVKLVSRDPWIMIIENFLTKEEADYLVEFAYYPSPNLELH